MGESHEDIHFHAYFFHAFIVCRTVACRRLRGRPHEKQAGRLNQAAPHYRPPPNGRPKPSGFAGAYPAEVVAFTLRRFSAPQKNIRQQGQGLGFAFHIGQQHKENAMKKLFLLCVLTTFCLVLPVSANAEKFDMRKVTCAEIDDENALLMIVSWMDGYQSAKTGDMVVDSKTLEKNVEGIV
jgi:hypothetical protein